MEFKAYHKIRQFKDIVRDIQYRANFKGLDEEQQPIYENSQKPILTFKGTVKLHGTNAGICYSSKEGVTAQKRSSLLESDNLSSHFGFNQFVQVNRKDELLQLMQSLSQQYCKEGEQIIIYGEWAGTGIQKSVGISELNKGFYVFDCKIYNPVTDEQRWLDIHEWEFDIEGVLNIHHFSTYSIDIDFNKPSLQQNKLIDITTEVERECPVSKQLGIEGVGEGVVWTCYWNDEKYIFKVKGEKHSVSKVKKLASVDPEVINSIHEFVEYACTENRVMQGVQEVNAVDKKQTPDLLRWVANDIIREESTELEANNLEWKQVARECSNRIRQIFFTYLDKV